MKKLKIRAYDGFDGKFNNNRDVLMYVNEEEKTVTLFLTCGYDEVEEKFCQAVYANGAYFRGYTFVAESPVVSGKKFVLSARIPL